MLVAKTKKYVFAGLGLLLLSLLLLTLSGCNATSDVRPSFQATGSWQGTIGADRVEGVVAPDRTYHLTIVDAAGNPVGVYVGVIGSIDSENIGSMTLVRLHTTEETGIQKQFTFKLSADRLFSLQGIELTRTGDANGPAVASAVAGHWSLAAADNSTEVVVNADGTLSGGDGVNCRYSGTLNLIDPTWNIFSLNMTLANLPGKLCTNSTNSDYSGLAMVLPPENARRRLWFAANNRIQGGVRTLFGEWSETINVAPVAQMTILGERADQSVLVQMQANASVELNAQGSFDANNDALTYAWSGTAPDGITPLNILGTGSAVTFIPLVEGVYTLTLTVSDGIEETQTLPRQLRVESTPDRFTGCLNGTVLDTRTNLLWLQNAGCRDLNLEVAANLWGFNALVAQERVNTLLATGVCSLTDNSVLGDWRLPTVNEFRQIVTTTPFAGPPALLNGTGTGQWTEGDVFVNVGATQTLDKRYIYWTADADPDPEALNNWLFVNFNYLNPADWSGSQFSGTRNSLWPVRALRPGEQCPSVPVP